jgi:hypothetical protein
MTKGFKLFIICLALVGESFGFLYWSTFLHGPMLDLRYRRTERLAAYHENRLHPSPAAQTALDLELSRMNNYLHWSMLRDVAILAIVNGIGFYFLWVRIPTKQGS